MPPASSGPPIGVMSDAPREAGADNRFVPVFVSLQANRRSLIVFGDDQRRIAECNDDCEFWAWPGAYRVRLQKNEHELESSVTLRVRHSGSYALEVGNKGAADGGLALGVVGTLVSVVGTGSCSPASFRTSARHRLAEWETTARRPPSSITASPRWLQEPA
jgi:hypothetical protein